MSDDLVFLYNDVKRSWLTMGRSDDRLDWAHKWTPDGMVRLRMRGKDRFRYVYHGSSKLEAAARANVHSLSEIAVLEEKLARLRAGLVRP